jgi:hypothetical protein
MEPIIPIAAIGLLLLLRKKKARKPSIPGVPGNGPSGPGPGKPKKPGKPGVPGQPGEPGQPGAPDPDRRYRWGDGLFPEDWDFDSNGFWISPDCDYVLEGWYFETYSWQKTISAIEASTLYGTLQEAPDNSVYGYLAYLINEEGVDTPPQLAIRVMQEASPMCVEVFADQDLEDWPPGLAEWFESFVERITPWVVEETGIPFEP